MPSPKGYKRDLKQEYKTAKRRGEVASGPSGKNAKRKAARRKMEKTHGKAALKGKDVDHINMNVKDNTGKNLRAVSPRKNRSFKRSGKQYGNGKRK